MIKKEEKKSYTICAKSNYKQILSCKRKEGMSEKLSVLLQDILCFSLVNYNYYVKDDNSNEEKIKTLKEIVNDYMFSSEEIKEKYKEDELVKLLDELTNFRVNNKAQLEKLEEKLL